MPSMMPIEIRQKAANTAQHIHWLGNVLSIVTPIAMKRLPIAVGNGQEEVGEDKHHGAGLHSNLNGLSKTLELLARGVVVRNSNDRQEDISTCCEEHTDNDLTRCRDLFATLSKSREDVHNDRRE